MSKESLRKAMNKLKTEATRQSRKSTVPPAAPAAKPERTVRWMFRQEEERGGVFGVLRITTGDTIEDYLVERVFGAVYKLTKLQHGMTNTYTVVLGTNQTCGCDAGRRGTACKHIAALNAKQIQGHL